MALRFNFLANPRLPAGSQLKASLLSLTFVTLALGLLCLGHWMQAELPETVTVREISLLMPPAPPPPPPPQQLQQPVATSSLQLQVEGAGPSLPMLTVDRPEIKLNKPDVPKIETTQTQWQSLEVNWDAFDLDDLDSMPALLTPIRAVIPRSLESRGINHILVKLDVLIDEQGQVTLIEVVQNPYPELASEIQKIVRTSRFSAPHKGDVPVRARFIWPIKISF